MNRVLGDIPAAHVRIRTALTITHIILVFGLLAWFTFYFFQGGRGMFWIEQTRMELADLQYTLANMIRFPWG